MNGSVEKVVPDVLQLPQEENEEHKFGKEVITGSSKNGQKHLQLDIIIICLLIKI